MGHLFPKHWSVLIALPYCPASPENRCLQYRNPYCRLVLSQIWNLLRTVTLTMRWKTMSWFTTEFFVAVIKYSDNGKRPVLRLWLYNLQRKGNGETMGEERKTSLKIYDRRDRVWSVARDTALLWTLYGSSWAGTIERFGSLILVFVYILQDTILCT